MPTGRTIWSCAIIALFFSILLLPLATHERRPYYLVRERHGRWATSLQEVEARFTKGLTVTQPLVKVYNRTRWTALGALPESIIPGRDGMWFYNSDPAKDGETMSDWFGKAAPGEAELAEWTGALAERDRRLAGLGIPYLLVLAPNKQSVLADRMPRHLQARRGEPRADAMLAAAAAVLRAPPLDLRRPLLAAQAGEQPLYYRTDSHWNLRGAFLAEKAIAKRMHALDHRIVPLDSTAWRWHQADFTGDILRLGFLDQLLQEQVPVPSPPAPLAARTAAGQVLLDGGSTLEQSWWTRDEDGNRLLAIDNPAGVEGTLLLFHDSFAIGLLPFLAQHYRRTIACWTSSGTPWHWSLVERHRPTIALHLAVERYLLFIGAQRLPALP